MGIRRGGVIVSKDPSPRLQHSQEEVHLSLEAGKAHPRLGP